MIFLFESSVKSLNGTYWEHILDSVRVKFQPVVQASQLLQMNKQTQAHALAICGTCTRLTSLQVKQHMYSNVVEISIMVTILYEKNVTCFCNKSIYCYMYLLLQIQKLLTMYQLLDDQRVPVDVIRCGYKE